MLEIKIVSDRKKTETLCNECGLSPISERSVMAADDSGEILGYTVFSMRDGALILERVEAGEDALLFDGLVRSTLHIAANRGLEQAYYTDGVDETLLSKLKFVKSRDEKLLDIDILFKSCCCDK